MTTTPLQPELLDALQRNLEEEIQQAQLTATKLSLKKQTLVLMQPEQLATVDQDLLLLHQKMKQLEIQRKDLMQQLGHPELTLGELITQMAPSRAGIFIQTREHLLRAMNDMARLNNDNRDLLSLSLQWMQDTLEVIITAITPQGASYDAKGEKPRGNTPDQPVLPGQSTVNHSA